MRLETQNWMVLFPATGHKCFQDTTTLTLNYEEIIKIQEAKLN